MWTPEDDLEKPEPILQQALVLDEAYIKVHNILIR